MGRAIRIGLAAILVGGLARADGADEKAAKWVEGVGGKATRGATPPGNPVVEVDLAANKKVTNDGLRELAGLKGLKRLSLFFDEQITDAGMAHLKGLTTLEELTLSNTGVGDAGIAELKGLKGLKKLHLAGAIRLTDAAAETINGFAELDDLSLPSTITGKGVGKLVGLKNLRSFYLGGGNPGDGAVEAIAATMPNLESLELGTFGLGGNGITDASVPHLAKLKKLKSVGLAGSKLTDAGLKELRAALPGCTITTR
jgi:internalin A